MAEQQRGPALPARLAESVAASILFGILSTLWAKSPIGTVLVVGSTAFVVWVVSGWLPNTPARWVILALAAVVFNVITYGISRLF